MSHLSLMICYIPLMSMLELYLNKILPLLKTQTARTDVSETVEIKFNKYGK